MTIALLVAASAAGCATLRSATAYEKLAAANLSARERLSYGLRPSDARARMGTTEVVPPWANARGIGPALVANPLDSLEFDSPGGERYLVDRYVVGLAGEPRCPFVRGHAQLIPLIYYDGALVGWQWDYLENVLQRRLTPAERSFSFGQFCDAPEADAPAP